MNYPLDQEDNEDLGIGSVQGSTWGGGPYLIVYLQRVLLTLCAKVLCVFVYGEVHLLVETLYEDRMPEMVIQQTA